MKNLLVIIVMVVALFQMEKGRAEKIDFVNIKSDVEKSTYSVLTLNLNDDTGEIEKLIMTDFKISSGERVAEFTYDAKGLDDGIVISENKGMPVVTLLSTEVFDFFTGGKITLQYLTNGVSKKYSKVDFQLMMAADGKWMLKLADETEESEKQIAEMFFEGNKKFPFGLVGIKRVNFKFAN